MSPENAVALLVVAIGAFIMPILANRLGVPAAVMEILYGIAVGATGFHAGGEFLQFLAELGFIVLMFIAGYEIDFAGVERGGGRPLWVSAALLAGVHLLALAAVWRLGWDFSLYLVVTAVSIGIVVVVLKEMKLSQTPFGQSLLLAGSLGEFITIILLTIFTFTHRFGFGLNLFFQLGLLVLLFGVAWLVLRLMYLAVWWNPFSFARIGETHDPSEIGIRGGFMLAFTFVALAALFGVEAILGSFIAGVLFAFVFRNKTVLEPKLSSIGNGFLVPFFFIFVGMNLDLAALWEGLSLWWLLLQIALVMTIVRVAPALLLKLRGLSVRQSISAGLLLTTPLTLLVAVAAVAGEEGVMSARMSAVVVMLAVVTALVHPVLARLVYPKRKEEPALEIES